MLRINRVEEFVRERCKADGGNGITTAEVADALGIWRSDASSFLNQLEKDGVLLRTKTRPVKFFLKEGSQKGGPCGTVSEALSDADSGAIFPNIIGSSGSLRFQSQLAQAAALYPPFGIHTLILGETGVGKSLMAEEIWRYILKHNDAQEKDIPFVTFNCAEYAENPQLLLSQLFGYERGAFTGAEKSRDGLIEGARNGVLFLDEMHRLPATGQEMFFMLIDKGVYRRLGGAEEREIQLMIIGATTENPESSFLATFRRRFPMLLQIPNLGERPIRERVQLVYLFLSREAKRLGQPIRITQDALKRMAIYHGEGNIGELKNIIQICCAKCYRAAVMSRTPKMLPVNITLSDLPRQMMLGYKEHADLEQYCASVLLDSMVTLYPDEDREHDMLLRLGGHAGDEQGDSPDPLISGSIPSSARNAIFGSISTNIWSLAQEIIRQASTELMCTYQWEACLSVALFLQQTQLYAMAGTAFRSDQRLPGQPNEAELAFVRKICPQIHSQLGIQLVERELLTLAMLLGRHVRQEVPRIRLLIVCHGDGIASGIARFANKILNHELAVGVDIPLDGSDELAYEQIEAVVKDCDSSQGIIFLNESTVLSAGDGNIFEHAGCAVRAIPFVNTILALELCMAIHTTDHNMDTIVENAVLEFQKYSQRMLYLGTERQLSAKIPMGESARKNVIITLCVTDMGSSNIAREYAMSVPFISERAEILSLGVTDDLDAEVDRLGKRLVLIIGFVDPQIKGVPFIGVENLFTQSGLNRINILLRQRSLEGVEGTPYDFKELSLTQQLELISKKIDRFAPSFEPSAISREVLRIVHAVYADSDESLEVARVVRLYIHTASIFERLYTAKAANIAPDGLPEQADAFIAMYRGYFSRLRQLLEESCSQLELPLSDTEVYYLMRSLPQFEYAQPTD